MVNIFACEKKAMQYVSRLKPAYTYSEKCAPIEKEVSISKYSAAKGNFKNKYGNLNSNEILNSFIFGVLFIIALYHLIVWIAGKKNKLNLIFSLLCILILIRIFSNNYYLSNFFPTFNLFEFECKLKFISIALCWYIFTQFLYYLFPNEVYIYFKRMLGFISLICIFIPLFFNYHIYKHLQLLYQIIIVMVCIWLLVINFNAIKNKRNGASYILVSLTFITFVSDIISFHFTTSNIVILLTLLLFIQSCILFYHSKATFKQCENVVKIMPTIADFKSEKPALQAYKVVKTVKEKLEHNESVEYFNLSAPYTNSKKFNLKDSIHEKNSYNILIVEDDSVQLKLLIHKMKGSFNIFYANDGLSALGKLDTIPMPHIIISDIIMDRMDGCEFYNQLLKIDNYADIPFIFLSAQNDIKQKIQLLNQGAVDYITKPFDINELIAKINSQIKINESKRILSERVMKKRILDAIHHNNEDTKNYCETPQKNYDKFLLTNREKEILDLVCNGKAGKEIGRLLHISIATVRTHMRHIYEKCNVQNRIELINCFK